MNIQFAEKSTITRVEALTVASPFGPCVTHWTADGHLCSVDFVEDAPVSCSKRAREVADALFDEDNGTIKAVAHGTDFQRAVWRALLDIPAGVTRTYRQIAEAVGRPTAFRAIGSAIGANPLAWLVPCHRVVRSDGQLGGYRWGLEVKRRMLAYEA